MLKNITMVLARGCLAFVIIVLVALVIPSESRARKAKLSRRVHIPMLGLGPFCDACPKHYCDDDPAIIFGYCCGCARFYDNLPIQCSTRIECPLNGYELCQDYEYMMYCCC